MTDEACGGDLKVVKGKEINASMFVSIKGESGWGGIFKVEEQKLPSRKELSSVLGKYLTGESAEYEEELIEEIMALWNAKPGMVLINEALIARDHLVASEGIINNAISNQAAVDYKSEAFRHAVRDVIRDELRANGLLSNI